MTDATAPETSGAATDATGRAFDSFEFPEPVREGVRAAGFTPAYTDFIHAVRHGFVE